MRQCGNITIALAGGIQSPILSASSVAPTEGSCTEDRLSHVTICSICETFALEEDVVVLCRNCPRTFCCACARSSAIETETPPAVMRIGPSRCGGHLETNRCPSCLHRRDEHFSAPLPGAKPMEHLVEALLKHDLSHAFRAPVDSTEYPDYVYRIGRNHMMDLQTMVEKLREGKYSSRRGRGTFKQDLNKIWRNCRFYADCDEQGVPLDETTVPGIVRCALILEKMANRFYTTHMRDQTGVVVPDTSWDGWRQARQLENEQARLQLSELQPRKMEANVDCVSAAAVPCLPLPALVDSEEDAIPETGILGGEEKNAADKVYNLVLMRTTSRKRSHSEIRDGCSVQNDESSNNGATVGIQAPEAAQRDDQTATDNRWGWRDGMTEPCYPPSPHDNMPDWSLFEQLCRVSVEFSSISVLEQATKPPPLRIRASDRGTAPETT